MTSRDFTAVSSIWLTAARHLFIPSQVAIWEGSGIKPCCYVSPELQVTTLPCAFYLQLLPYRLKLFLIYLLYLQEADIHTEEVLLLPRKYVPVILWSSLPFLLPSITTAFIYWPLLYSVETPRWYLQEKLTIPLPKRELSYKDITLLQSQNKARARRSPQFSSDTTDAGSKGTKVILQHSNWTICKCLVALLLNEAGSEREAWTLFIPKKPHYMKQTAETAKMVSSIRVLLDSS